MANAKDVVVVGAGFAGLSAALALHRAGAAVTVLEARDRVGGRVWSVLLSNGAVAELGAEWIEESDRAVIAAAAEMGLELLPAGVDYRRREALGSLAAGMEEQDRAVAVARRAREAIDPSEAEVTTLGTFLRSLALEDRQRATLWARLQGTHAQDLDLISLAATGSERTFDAGSGRHLRTAGGNQGIAEAFGSKLPDVRLGHEVRVVRQTELGVAVQGTAGGASFRVEATTAVVALPVSVAAAIEYSPALPRRVAEALEKVPMGSASKLAVPIETGPLPRARMDVDVPYWCWIGIGEEGRVRPTLTAFAGSPAAQDVLATATNDPRRWLERLLAANPDVVATGEPVMTAWAQDRFSRGCYSAFDQTACRVAPVLREPQGRLVFAGEHTADGDTGTMNGALSSGSRAAALVSAILRAN